jgi:hypothetical protein
MTTATLIIAASCTVADIPAVGEGALEKEVPAVADLLRSRKFALSSFSAHVAFLAYPGTSSGRCGSSRNETLNLPEVGMEEFRIKPDGDGFEVTRILPDGKTCFVGWFSREYDAQYLIESRVRLAQRREISSRSSSWQ